MTNRYSESLFDTQRRPSGLWFRITCLAFAIDLIPCAVVPFDWNPRGPAVAHYIAAVLAAEAIAGIAALILMFRRQQAGWMIAVGLTGFRATYCLVTLFFYLYFAGIAPIIALLFAGLVLVLLSLPGIRYRFRVHTGQFWNAGAIGFACAIALYSVLLFGLL